MHRLIEERGLRFLLTGSSARKLRRGGMNLLGGRARELHLHPFSASELGREFSLDRALNVGLLPAASAVAGLAEAKGRREAKARRAVGRDDLRGLRELRKEGAFKRFVVASLEPRPRIVDGIEILPWRTFVERLWSGDFK